MGVSEQQGIICVHDTAGDSTVVRGGELSHAGDSTVVRGGELSHAGDSTVVRGGEISHAGVSLVMPTHQLTHLLWGHASSAAYVQHSLQPITCTLSMTQVPPPPPGTRLGDSAADADP